MKEENMGIRIFLLIYKHILNSRIKWHAILMTEVGHTQYEHDMICGQVIQLYHTISKVLSHRSAYKRASTFK